AKTRPQDTGLDPRLLRHRRTVQIHRPRHEGGPQGLPHHREGVASVNSRLPREPGEVQGAGRRAEGIDRHRREHQGGYGYRSCPKEVSIRAKPKLREGSASAEPFAANSEALQLESTRSRELWNPQSRYSAQRAARIV